MLLCRTIVNLKRQFSRNKLMSSVCRMWPVLLLWSWASFYFYLPAIPCVVWNLIQSHVPMRPATARPQLPLMYNIYLYVCSVYKWKNLWMNVTYSSQTFPESLWPSFSFFSPQPHTRTTNITLHHITLHASQVSVLTCQWVQALINRCSIQDLLFNVTRNWLRPCATSQRSGGLAGWAMRGGTPQVETER